MKSLNKYIQEKLIINKDYKDYSDTRIVVKTVNELRNIIEDRYDKLGPGTKQDPIDFNDINVSNIYSFYNNDNKYKGLFEGRNFKYIDISSWDVSNVRSMYHMFYGCIELKSIGDITKWDVSNVSDMLAMFYWCKSFNQDISSWDVSNVTDMSYMFYECKSFNQDLSRWNVYKVANRSGMFYDCPIKEEYKPKFK